MKTLLAAALTALTVMAAKQAHAAPNLGDKVYSPYIEDGETSVEIHAGRALGKVANGDSGAIIELEQGFNSRFSGALVAELEDQPGGKRKIDSLGVEGVLSLGTIPFVDIDTGLYAEYEQRIHNESGVGELKALFAKRVGGFEARLNLIAQHPFSRDEHQTDFTYAASTTWKVAGDFRVGAEAFGDLGHDAHWGGHTDHYVGPLATYVIGLPYVGIKLEAAYLVALGAARDRTTGQARLGVELEKRW